MPGTSTTPSGVTPAGYVPNFARRDGLAADPTLAPPSTAGVPHIAPELITQVLTLEAANEARRVIADARRRLAEIAARAPQAPLLRHPDETPPVRDAPPTLHAITARTTPPTLRAQPTPTSVAPTRQDPPAPAPPAASPGVSREYQWEQAVKAPYERPAVAAPAPAPAAPARRSGSGQSREYEWEQAVKAPYQPPPQKGPAGVLESLKSAAFPSPNPTPDQRRSERR
jgi:hypothetical protein